MNCPFNDNCELNRVTRKFCPKCRLRKCFTTGMVKEWILSEAEKEQKRRIREERQLNIRTLFNERQQKRHERNITLKKDKKKNFFQAGKKVVEDFNKNLITKFKNIKQQPQIKEVKFETILEQQLQQQLKNNYYYFDEHLYHHSKFDLKNDLLQVSFPSSSSASFSTSMVALKSSSSSSLSSVSSLVSSSSPLLLTNSTIPYYYQHNNSIYSSPFPGYYQTTTTDSQNQLIHYNHYH